MRLRPYLVLILALELQARRWSTEHARARVTEARVTTRRVMTTTDADALAIEVQPPYAAMLVDGKKTIDVRAYASERAWRTPCRVWVVETSGGTHGRAVLGESWTSEDGEAMFNDEGDDGAGPRARVIGWIELGGTKEYRDGAAFDADAERHRVDESSAYYPDFESGGTWYGWHVVRAARVDDAPAVVSQRRLFRSVHALRFKA